MKYYTKSKCSRLILASLIAISSCNGVNDPQPNDLETIPEQLKSSSVRMCRIL